MRLSIRCTLILLVVMAGVVGAKASCDGTDAIAPASVTEVAPGHFVRFGVHELMTRENAGGIANTGFIVGATSVAVVDSGGSACDGLRLRAAIRVRTKLPIRYVIATHMHPDHQFGHAAFIQDDPQFIGHAKLPAALAARGSHYLTANQAVFGSTRLKTRVVIPKTLVSDRHTIDLGHREIILLAWGAAHTNNDLTVYDTKTRTLWTGDLLFEGHLPVIDGSLVGWLQVLDDMAGLKVQTVIPGHGRASRDWPGFLTPQVGYLTRLAADLRRLIADGATIAQATERTRPADHAQWKLFDEFHPRNATAAFAELEWE